MNVRSILSGGLGRERRERHFSVDGVRYNDRATALLVSQALGQHDGRAHLVAETINVRRRPS